MRTPVPPPSPEPLPSSPPAQEIRTSPTSPSTATNDRGTSGDALAFNPKKTAKPDKGGEFGLTLSELEALFWFEPAHDSSDD
jgi:hypothetical protein